MLTVIINPIAGNGLSMSLRKDVFELLDLRKFDYRVRETKKVGDAEIFAREAASEPDSQICVMGGDGTVNEVVNALAGTDALCLFVPCGTGNDFAKALGLPRDPIKSLRAQLDGDDARVDLGCVGGRTFANVSGAGFDVEVLRQTVRFKWMGRGLLPYLFGVITAIRHFKPLDVELTIADGDVQHEKLTIISVGNGQFIGGGMRAVPNAIIDDGLFDVVIVNAVKRRDIVRLMPDFISGRHIDLPITRVLRCTKLTVKSPGMFVNIDGEIVPCDNADYELLPGALRVKRLKFDI